MTRHTFMILIIAVLLAGCAVNLGTQAVNDFGRYMQLERDVTTKEQIHEIFGQPHEVRGSSEASDTMWSYYSYRIEPSAISYIPWVGMLAGGVNRDTARAVFHFDVDGILIHSERTESARYEATIISIGDRLTSSGQVELVRQEMLALGLPFDEELAEENAIHADLAE